MLFEIDLVCIVAIVIAWVVVSIVTALINLASTKKLMTYCENILERFYKFMTDLNKED